MPSSSRDPGKELRRALREQRRSNRLGEGASCEACGDSALVHLRRIADQIVCACCLAIAQRGEILERHHLAGHHEGPTVNLCANCHAELTELQRDWLNDGLSFQERLARGLDDYERLCPEKGRKL